MKITLKMGASTDNDNQSQNVSQLREKQQTMKQMINEKIRYQKRALFRKSATL